MGIGRKILIGICALAGITLVAQVAREMGGATPVAQQKPGYVPDIAMAAVRSRLRDPDSAQFGEMNLYTDRKLNGRPISTVCGSVNAKNGFGRYTGAKSFIVTLPGYTAAIEEDKGFVSLWNAVCAGRHKV